MACNVFPAGPGSAEIIEVFGNVFAGVFLVEFMLKFYCFRANYFKDIVINIDRS